MLRKIFALLLATGLFYAQSSSADSAPTVIKAMKPITTAYTLLYAAYKTSFPSFKEFEGRTWGKEGAIVLTFIEPQTPMLMEMIASQNGKKDTDGQPEIELKKFKLRVPYLLDNPTGYKDTLSTFSLAMTVLYIGDKAPEKSETDSCLKAIQQKPCSVSKGKFRTDYLYDPVDHTIAMTILAI